MAKSNVSSVGNHFPTVNEGFATTVAGGGITSGGVEVTLSDVAALDDTTIFVGIVEPGLPNEQVFTGTVDKPNSKITGVKWTRGTNTSHAAGTTVVDYITGTAISMITKGLSVSLNQDGTLKDDVVGADQIAPSAYTLFTPAGVVTDFAGTTAPDGWLLCYGQAVSRATYAKLFATISTTYGVGDGTSTFNLPDLRGRVVAGQDDMGGSSANRLTNPAATVGGIDGDVLGGSGGAETHTLTQAQMPVHSHGISDPGHAHGPTGSNSFDGPGAGSYGLAAGGVTRMIYQTTTTNATGVTVNNAGSGTAHNVVQPTLILNKIIKT